MKINKHRHIDPEMLLKINPTLLHWATAFLEMTLHIKLSYSRYRLTGWLAWPHNGLRKYAICVSRILYKSSPDYCLSCQSCQSHQSHWEFDETQKIISRYTKLYETVSDFVKISHLLWSFTKKKFLNLLHKLCYYRKFRKQEISHTYTIFRFLWHETDTKIESYSNSK